jgi:excisionase family DNA binding protein
MLKTTFTLGEASQLLSCHKETLRRAIMEGRLRAAKLGRGYRISRVDLQVFWIAMGGGELFDRDDLSEDEILLENSLPAPKKPKAYAPEQLKLLT